MRSQGITNVGQGYFNEKLDAIHGLDAAMAFLSSIGGTLTADGTEENNMQGGDTIEVKIYHRMTAAGALQLLAFHTWTGADGGLTNSEKLDVVDLHPNRHGYRSTLDQTAGTNRAYTWEVFSEV